MTGRLVELPPAPAADAEDTVRLLRPVEVGERLGLSRRKVYELIEDGDLDAVLVGSGQGEIRVRLTDLQAYIATLPKRVPRARRRPAAAAPAR